MLLFSQLLCKRIGHCVSDNRIANNRFVSYDFNVQRLNVEIITADGLHSFRVARSVNSDSDTDFDFITRFKFGQRGRSVKEYDSR
jgi:hypothetical protein